MKNPKWQEAENSRMSAEEEYATYMAFPKSDPEEHRKKVLELNAEIEVCNQLLRSTPDQI